MLSAPLVHGAYRGGPSHLPGFSLVCDFKRGLYRRGVGRGRMVTDYLQLPGASYTRAGADMVLQTPFGLRRFAAHVPPIVPGFGLMGPDSTTNFCSGRNFPGAGAPVPGVAFGDASIALVAREALPPGALLALNTEDPEGHVTHAWRMTAPAGPSGINIEGSTAGGPINTFSAFVYVASGNIEIGSSSNEGLVPCGTGFTRSIAKGVAVGGTRTLRLRVAAGSPPAEVYWFGHQSEAKGFASAVAVVSGTPASRGAPVASVAGLGAEFGSAYTLVVKGRFPVIEPANNNSEVMIWASEAGSSVQFNLRRAQNAGAVALGLSTGTNINIPSPDPNGAPFAAALRVDEASGASRFVTNGQARADVRAWPNAADLYFAGNSSGSTPLRAPIEFAGIIPLLVSDAELFTLGTVQ